MIKGIHTTDPDLVKELGFTMQRAWDFGMDIKDTYLENPRGSWEYELVADNKVEPFQENGMEVLGVLVADHPWRAPDTDPKNLQNPSDDTNQWDKLSNWQQYVSAASWGGNSYKLRAWEVWNEPNHRGFWQPEHPDGKHYSDKESAALYIETVKQAATILHSRRQLVVAGASVSSVRFVDEIIEQGIGEYIDVFSVHYDYRGEDSFQEAFYRNRIKAIQAKLGGIPIWNTETNCGVWYIPDKERIYRWWNVNRDLGIEALFYYYARQQNDNNPENLANEEGLKSWTRTFEGLY